MFSFRITLWLRPHGKTDVPIGFRGETPGFDQNIHERMGWPLRELPFFGWFVKIIPSD